MEAIVSLAAVFVPALLVFGIVYLVELVRFYRAAAAQRRDNG